LDAHDGELEKHRLTKGLSSLYTIAVNNLLLSLWISFFWMPPLRLKC